MINPSSRHLSHDFPAFKGLTLRELGVLVVITTLAACCVSTVIGAAFGWPLLCGASGVILGFIVAIVIMPKMVSRLKAGKPQGYLLKKTRMVFVRLKIIQSPYLNHKGHWQTVKRLGEKRV
jgi:conjugative transfer region protein (TIGR03750 family)